MRTPMTFYREFPDSGTGRRIAVSISFVTIAALSLGCKRQTQAPAPPIPEVSITKVIQRNVPEYSEWVGTTEGFVNASIYRKISGYLIKQNYRDGDVVHAGQLLFQIDPREYQAALDQATGNLAQALAQFQQNQLNCYTNLLALFAENPFYSRMGTRCPSREPARGEVSLRLSCGMGIFLGPSEENGPIRKHFAFLDLIER
jgi:hypothetical protein